METKPLSDLLDRNSALTLIDSYCLDAPSAGAIDNLINSHVTARGYRAGYVPHDHVIVKTKYNGLEVVDYAVSQSILDRLLYS